VKPHKLPWNESVNFLHSDYKELGLFCFLQMAGHKDDFPRIKVTGSDHNGSTFAGQASKLWPKTLTYTLRQLAPLLFFFFFLAGKVIFLSNILPLQRTTTVNGHHNRNNSIQALKKVFALAYMKGKQELRRAEVGAAPAALKIIARQSWLTAGWPHDVPLPRPLCPCDRP